MKIGLINMEMSGGMKDYHIHLRKIIEESKEDSIELEILLNYTDDREIINILKKDNIYNLKISKKYKLFFTLFTSFVDRKVNEIINNNDQIDLWIVVWDSYFLKKIVNWKKILLIIHDLENHETKYDIKKKIFRFIMLRRNISKRKKVKTIITNSKKQFYLLKEQYKLKTINYLPMLSTVTNEIAEGNEIINELQNIDDYILFFGRIEYYKGVHNLVEAYNLSDLNEKLVIAGKGKIYFKEKNNNIIFINRFIKDNEVRKLFEKSKFVVFPYISATQVGPLSIAYYFKKPVLVSGLSAFIEKFDFNNPPGIIVDSNDIISLKLSLEFLSKNSKNEYIENSQLAYKNLYENISWEDKI